MIDSYSMPMNKTVNSRLMEVVNVIVTGEYPTMDTNPRKTKGKLTPRPKNVENGMDWAWVSNNARSSIHRQLTNLLTGELDLKH